MRKVLRTEMDGKFHVLFGTEVSSQWWKINTIDEAAG